MLTLVGTLGGTDYSIGLPRIHNYAPDLHHIRFIDICGRGTSRCWRESGSLVHASLESQTGWLVEAVEILPSRVVEGLET
jgi:hypothetical protein